MTSTMRNRTAITAIVAAHYVGHTHKLVQPHSLYGVVTASLSHGYHHAGEWR